MRSIRGPVPGNTPKVDYKVGSRENAGAARRAAPVVLSVVAAAAVMLAGCAKAGAEKQDTVNPGDRPPGAGAPQYPKPETSTGNATPGPAASNKTPVPSDGVTSSTAPAESPSSAAATTPSSGGGQGGGLGNTAMPDSCRAQFEERPGNKLRVTVTADVPPGKSFYSGHTVNNPQYLARVYEGGDFTIPYPNQAIAIVAVGGAGVMMWPGPGGSYNVDIGQPFVLCGNFQP